MTAILLPISIYISINNIDISLTFVATTHDGNIIADIDIHMDFCYFTIFKDYVTGLEVLAGYSTNYLFVVPRSRRSKFTFCLHYIEVDSGRISTKYIQKNTCFLSLLFVIISLYSKK